jgi:hypothetical protein
MDSSTSPLKKPLGKLDKKGIYNKELFTRPIL